jgi:hypothetical protein
MISLVISSAIAMAGLQATIAAPRAAFMSCLKQASAKAASDKVGADSFEAALRSACSAQASSFKGALVSFDVKNGVARKQAATDADLQIDDYLASQLDNYSSRLPASIAKAEPAAPAAPANSGATPTPVQASAPK